MGFRSARLFRADIGGPGNAAGDDGGGIMVAGEKEHRDFGPIQAAHGAGEIEAGAHVLPLTVEEVASDHDEIDIFVDGALYQIVESRAGGSSYVVLGQTFISRQAMERAVEMNVGGMQETKIAQNSYHLESGDILWVTEILSLCSAPWENTPNMAAELLDRNSTRLNSSH